jgi:hypothetical protein
MLAFDPAHRPTAIAAAAVLGVGSSERKPVETMTLLAEFQQQQQARLAATKVAPRVERPLLDLVSDIKEAMGIETKSMKTAIDEATEQLGVDGATTLKEKAIAAAIALDIDPFLSQVPPFVVRVPSLLIIGLLLRVPR